MLAVFNVNLFKKRTESEIGDREGISSDFLVKKRGFLRLRFEFNIFVNENVHINNSQYLILHPF